MSDEIDFVYHGPLCKIQKWCVHPKNDESRSKPHNVVWTSPVNPKTNEANWMEWCRCENFRVAYFEQNKYHIVPNQDCKILTLLPESPEIDKYTIKNKFNTSVLDFEAIAKDYDALYVPIDTVWEYPMDLLSGWDVSTCIFLKPKYTVMDDEIYALYKAGKINLKDSVNTDLFDPQVNLHPRSLPPFSFMQPVDVSIEAAVCEFRQMAKAQSKRSSKAREKAFRYYDVAQKLEKFKSFKFLGHDQDLLLRDDQYLINQPDVLEVLLKHGMNPNLKLKIFGSYYFLTEVADCEKSYKLLLQYGADPNALLRKTVMYYEELSVAKLCLAAGANVNFSDENGVTPLMNACGPEHVELLLSFGANPLAVDKNGKSVQEYFEEQPVYYARVLNCKMLDIAKQNIFVHDKMANLRSVLQQKSVNETEKAKADSMGDSADSVRVFKVDEQNKNDR